MVYRIVTVDDSYAENTKPTHIVGVTDQVMDPRPPPPLNQKLYKVYVGWVKCTKQYEKLISFTGNDGGPELRFGGAYAKVDATGHVITHFPFVPANLSRKDVRRSRWVHILLLWNTNWTTDQVSNAMGIYEADNRGTLTLSATLAYKINSSTTISATATATVQSQDAVIRNINIDRNFYFTNGTANQGWGFQDLWPIWDGSNNVSYTLPYEIVN